VTPSFPCEPRVKILDRYIITVLVHDFAYALAVLLAIFSVINLTEELRLADAPTYGIPQALTYVVLRLPAEAYALFPASAVLGTVLGLGQLQRDHELVALQAAGVSRGRLSLTVLMVAATLALTGAGLGEMIAAPLSQRAQSGRALALSGHRTLSTPAGLWLRDGSRFVNVGQVQSDGSLSDLNVFDLDEERTLRRVTHARSASREGAQWTLEAVRDSVFGDGTVTTRHADTDTWDAPVDAGRLRMLALRPEDFSIAELHRAIAWQRQQRQNPLQYEILFWHRLGVPLYTALMVMLALPVVLATGPRVQVGAYIVRGALIGIGFQMFQQTFTSFGLVTALPPLVTVLTPAAVALAAVAVLYRWGTA
jgi:lipopolysaccharide export system permease protein